MRISEKLQLTVEEVLKEKQLQVEMTQALEKRIQAHPLSIQEQQQ